MSCKDDKEKSRQHEEESLNEIFQFLPQLIKDRIYKYNMYCYVNDPLRRRAMAELRQSCNLTRAKLITFKRVPNPETCCIPPPDIKNLMKIKRKCQNVLRKKKQL